MENNNKLAIKARLYLVVERLFNRIDEAGIRYQQYFKNNADYTKEDAITYLQTEVKDIIAYLQKSFTELQEHTTVPLTSFRVDFVYHITDIPGMVRREMIHQDLGRASVAQRGLEHLNKYANYVKTQTSEMEKVIENIPAKDLK